MITLTDKKEFSDVTVIIPTLNEGQSIRSFLLSLVNRYPQINCLIADDGSKDGTREIVHDLHQQNKRISLLDRSDALVKGLSAAVKDGICECNTKYYVVMDGDYQHPPEYVEACVANLIMGSDICVGTRAPYCKKWRFSRIVISAVAAFIAKTRLLINGVTIEDPMSGFFGGKTEFARKILRDHGQRLELRGYKILLNILKFVPEQTRLSGFYFDFGMREYDVSKFRAKLMYYFFLSIIK